MGKNLILVENYFYMVILLALFMFIVLKYFSKYKKVIFFASLPVFTFIILCEGVLKNRLMLFDKYIYTFISHFTSENMTYFMKMITNMGSPTVLIIIAFIFLLIFKFNKRNLNIIYIVIFNLVFSWIFNEIFKEMFHRQRPNVLEMVKAGGYSFPSGHSMISVSFYGLLVYLLNRRIKSPLIRYTTTFILCLLILTVGISRIYLGVHYASDVLAGFSAGLAWLVIYISIIDQYCTNE